MDKEPENINVIIEGCKNNNLQAQEKLYRSFYRVMMSLCLRYTKNEFDALEVLNTGFYKVYKNIGKYDVLKGSLNTWISTIIINSCLDFIKSQKNVFKGEGLQQVAIVQEQPVVFANISATEILRMVQKLPPATQAVFNLYVMEGYNHIEIGKLLDISDGTSKWHLSEARKRMQKMIKEQNS